MFLRRGRDKVIRNIEKRIADYTFIPAGTRTGQYHAKIIAYELFVVIVIHNLLLENYIWETFADYVLYLFFYK